jgi:hypothetical protein
VGNPQYASFHGAHRAHRPPPHSPADTWGHRSASPMGRGSYNDSHSPTGSFTHSQAPEETPTAVKAHPNNCMCAHKHTPTHPSRHSAGFTPALAQVHLSLRCWAQTAAIRAKTPKGALRGRKMGHPRKATPALSIWCCPPHPSQPLMSPSTAGPTLI